MIWLRRAFIAGLKKLNEYNYKNINSIKELRELNNYTSFNSIEDSRAFGKKLYGNWLSDFQKDGKFDNWFLSDFNFYKMNKFQKDFFQSYYSCDFDTKYHECEIYETFMFYCGNVYDQINTFCRNGFIRWDGKYNYYKNYDEDNCLRLSNMVTTMCNEISKFKLDENIITYRLLAYDDLLHCNNLKKIKKGDVVTHKGFLSTGLVLDILLKEHDYDTIFKIYVPTGCNALYLDFISNRVNEQELLLLPNTELEIISIKVLGCFSKRKRLIVCKVSSRNSMAD